MEQKPNTQEEIKGEDFKEENESVVSTSDEGNKTEESTEKSTNESKKSQEELEKEEEKAKNARFAEMRRKKEAEEKAKKDAEISEREKKIKEEAILEAKLGLISKNPYTDEPIKDEEDLKIFEIQKALDDEGKDPISDLPKRLAEINRKIAKEAKEKAEKEQKEKAEAQSKIDNEISEFHKKYPEIDTAKLADDPIFKECLNGRAGRWTLVEVYEFYLLEIAKNKAKSNDEKSKTTIDENSKKISKAPSSSSGGKLPKKSVSDMSEAEFREYWKKKYGD